MTFTATVFLTMICVRAAADEPRTIVDLPGSGTDPSAVDYESLPRLTGEHAVVNSVACSPGFAPGEKLTMGTMRLNLHNYLARFDDRFWCIWSDGPRVEDWPTQEIKYATSADGLTWSEAQSVTGTPDEPYAYIARGLWIRDGELLALGAHYKGKGAFGVDKELQLRAFVWDPAGRTWKPRGTVFDDAINNFPPQKLPSGEWIMTRRDAGFNVTMLIGGRERLDDWQAFPVVRHDDVSGFRPDEPIFWRQPDDSLNALFRDNGGSQRLFQATSHDLGKTWSTPRITNFPNARSKLFSIATSRGYRVLVLNANPKAGRRQLHLSVSPDGARFTRLALLDIPTPEAPRGFESIWTKFENGTASLQYPHVIEHNNCLWIALSRCKVQTEVFRVSLNAIDRLCDEP
ncbi:MAG: exo-alpha-sialidase [Planctomycetota bacterium]